MRHSQMFVLYEFVETSDESTNKTNEHDCMDEMSKQ